MEFEPFASIHRYRRPAVVTEKIDGISAQVVVRFANPELDNAFVLARVPVMVDASGGPDHLVYTYCYVYAGSRERYITSADDCEGFASWVQRHAEDLARLGVGRHCGEWYGRGIGRGYGLKHRRFALFNAARWSDAALRPDCCFVVPVLARCRFDDAHQIGECAERLRAHGSVAVPGYARPEGIVIFHAASNMLYKQTLERDEVPKSAVWKDAAAECRHPRMEETQEGPLPE